jgi:hypothetical protein
VDNRNGLTRSSNRPFVPVLNTLVPFTTLRDGPMVSVEQFLGELFERAPFDAMSSGRFLFLMPPSGLCVSTRITLPANRPCGRMPSSVAPPYSGSLRVGAAVCSDTAANSALEGALIEVKSSFHYGGTPDAGGRSG